MGLIEQELYEIRRLRQRSMSGTINQEEFEQQRDTFKLSIPLIKMRLDCEKLAFLYKPVGKKLRAINLIGDDRMGDNDKIDFNEEQVICPAKGNTNITRADCLDYSGEAEHIKSCEKCDHFGATRKLLMPL